MVPLSVEAAAMCTLDQKKGTARLKKIIEQLRAIVEGTFLPSISSMVNDLNFPDPESQYVLKYIYIYTHTHICTYIHTHTYISFL